MFAFAFLFFLSERRTYFQFTFSGGTITLDKKRGARHVFKFLSLFTFHEVITQIEANDQEKFN